MKPTRIADIVCNNLPVRIKSVPGGYLATMEGKVYPNGFGFTILEAVGDLIHNLGHNVVQASILTRGK